MPLASTEEMESNDIVVSIAGDKVCDLVREGNFTIVQGYVLRLKIYWYGFMWEQNEITCR